MAAFNVAGLGLLLIVVPHLAGPTVLMAAFRPLAPVGWMLLLLGVILVVVQRRRPSGDQKLSVPASPFPRLAKEPRWPSKPAPLVERIEPVDGPPSQHFILEPASPEPRARPTAWGPEVFAVIEWRRFEAVVETLFAQAGFITKAQSHGPDEGVDVWLYSKNQPDGLPVSVVQCKHWGKRVGVDKVRELRGVMAAKNVTRGQFATSSSFTPDAITFGAANGIKLHDGAGLLGVIARRTPEQQQALLDVALDGDYWRPTCASCGVKMIEKTPSGGGTPFWGCVNFPRCRTTMQMRVGGSGRAERGTP
jgi:restriction system protein